MNQRRALITGITGQDGSYLAELLLEQGYEVFGLVRRSSSANLARIQHILPRLHLVQGDLLDQSSLMRALSESRPQELYNLAAQSFVPTSFDEPVHTAEITGIGVTRDRKSTRLNSSHVEISYAVFCLKKKKTKKFQTGPPIHLRSTQYISSDVSW